MLVEILQEGVVKSIMSYSKLELIYFRLRALAEAPQMMLKFADIDYSYTMASEYFNKPWKEAKADVAFNQLPLLIVDEKIEIWQSNSIVRFLAPITGTMPEDKMIAAQADSIFESTHELFFPLNPTVNVFVGEHHNNLKKQFLETFPTKLKNFTRQLEKLSNGPFFFGKKPYYCDFSAYHHFSLAKLLDNEILSEFPKITNFMDEFEKLNNIAEYLKNRPELIEIGKSPKMIINGEKLKTGG